ncbi:MAG: class I SAM-dependent methyltransferase [Anaerolineae bacterium]|nr:class I SAM-dependent methyltransferase [Anaerolineae bacterium]
MISSEVKPVEFYESYFDNDIWPAFYWDVGSFCTRKSMRDLIQHKTGRLLEIGVGVGCGLYDLPGFNRFGADYALKTANLANSNLSYLGHMVPMLQADGQNLPFQSDTFDVIISAHTFEHIPDDKRVFRECERILTSGGELVIFVPGRIDGSVTPDEWEKWGHFRSYNEQHLRELESDCSMLSIKEIYFVHKPHSLIWNRAKHWLGYLNSPFRRIILKDGKSIYERKIYQRYLLTIVAGLLDYWDEKIRSREEAMGNVPYNVLTRLVKS